MMPDGLATAAASLGAIAAAVPVVAIEGYLAFNLGYLLLTLCGALAAQIAPAKLPAVRSRPPLRFAVLIAARNEARVIGDAVASIRAQLYGGPVRVAVVADHCRDATAEQARRAGAEVYERSEGSGSSTKGRALAWLWRQLPRTQDLDAVAVLDADNVAAPDFLDKMNRELSRGFRVVQGLRATKNPDESHASRLDGLAEALNQRVEAAGRRQLGLSGPISGSGMALAAAEFARLVEGDSDSVVEDCEWQIRLLLAGVPIHWTPEALIYDEKVTRYADIPAQRGRWMRGKASLVGRYLPGVARTLVARTSTMPQRRGAAQALLALATVLPKSLLGGAILGGWAASALGLRLPGLWPSWVWAIGSLALMTYFGGAMALARPGPDLWRSLPHLPRFGAALLLAFLLAPLRKRDWVATPHRGRPKSGGGGR